MKTWRMNENYKDGKLVSVEFQICKDEHNYYTVSKAEVKNGTIDVDFLNNIYAAYSQDFQQDKFIVTKLSGGE